MFRKDIKLSETEDINKNEVGIYKFMSMVFLI